MASLPMPYVLYSVVSCGSNQGGIKSALDGKAASKVKERIDMVAADVSRGCTVAVAVAGQQQLQQWHVG